MLAEITETAATFAGSEGDDLNNLIAHKVFICYRHWAAAKYFIKFSFKQTKKRSTDHFRVIATWENFDVLKEKDK